MENADKAIVLLIVIVSAVVTWKMVFDFYKPKFHRIFTHLIAVATASFMFMSTMILFVPKNYQRGATAEVEFSFMSLVTVIVMLAAIYLFFKYIPSRNNK
jgi:hypothetical protein